MKPNATSIIFILRKKASKKWLSCYLCPPGGERVRFHTDAVTLIRPDEITTGTAHTVSIPDAEILDNTVFPAVEQATLADLVIFKDFFPAPRAFDREHDRCVRYVSSITAFQYG
jgi:hypothetical protein